MLLDKIRHSFCHFPFLLQLIFIGQLHFIKVEAEYNCTSPGKFPDPENTNRYHQCIYLHGSISHVHNYCPSDTCFNDITKYCSKQFCPDYVASHTGGLLPSEIPPGPNSYDCTTLQKVRCKKHGLFAHPLDHSVYIKCSKISSKWVAICFTCNKKHQTCFSNTLQACITHGGKPCGKGIHTENPFHIISNPPPSTLTYDCEGYSQYPCDILGNGDHSMPGDKSVHWSCSGSGNDIIGLCSVCPKETRSCFIERKGQCVINCGLGYLHKPYSCTSYKGPDNFPCKNEGLFPNPEDTSVFFNCQKSDNSSDFDAECFTCNRQKKTCFSQNYQACVTYSRGDICPMSDIIDGPNEDNSIGSVDSSLTWDCSGYNDNSFPCMSYQDVGIYNHPGDKTVYFNCIKLTKHLWVAQCTPCNKETNSCYNWETEQCVKHCAKTTHKPYDCSTYEQNSFQCKTTGYFQNLNDTSIYFGCFSSSNGTLSSLCFSCNSKFKSCFDNNEKRCVSNSGKDSCGKAQILEGNSDKGTAENSLTYSCDGYSKESFPCYAYEEGLYALPGDPSVYVSCTSKGDNIGDGVDQVLSKYDSCHTCPEHNQACFDNNLKQCLKQCGKAEESGKTESSIGIDLTSGQDLLMNLSIEEGPVHCDDYIYKVPHCTSTQKKSFFQENAYFFYCHNDIKGDWKDGCYNCIGQECIKKPKLKKEEYSCGANKFRCKSSGLYVHPNRTASVYFRCVKHDTQWMALCFTCNQYGLTCFDEDQQACVGFTASSKSCGTGADFKDLEDKKTWQDSLSYSCKGYEGDSFPCYTLQPGLHRVPGDISIYYLCKKGQVYGECRTCSKKDKTCFNPITKTCTKNCEESKLVPLDSVKGSLRPYDCTGFTMDSFSCKKEGLFPHPHDITIFFKCEKIPKTNQLISTCFACNSATDSCFRQEKGRCVQNCKGKGTATYGTNCIGYGLSSLSCETKMNNLINAEDAVAIIPNVQYNYLHSHIGDPAVYLQCIKINENWASYCGMCPVSTCFNEKLQLCVKEGCNEYKPTAADAQLGLYKPYDCRFYPIDAYPCTEEGTFANPTDTSVYFQCTKVGGKYEAHCYSCNSELATCFVQSKGACFKTNQTKCGNIQQTGSTTVGNHMTYQCVGYDPPASFPCDLLGAGTFGMPGDLSVYWNCKNNGNGDFLGECKTCSKEDLGCFDFEKSVCVDECDHKIYKPYDCSIYEENEFNCPKEGYFSQEFDSSVFFKCTKLGKIYQTECYTCNKYKKTCFSDRLQACITKGDKPCGYNDPSASALAGTEESSRAYNCEGYSYKQFPCEAYSLGNHPLKGDISVFISCQKTNKHWELASCKACDWATNSCYDEKKRKCIENCGKGPHKPYDCSTYDEKSFNCTTQGFFQNPADNSIFFECTQVTIGGTTKLKPLCYTCNKLVGTCFDEQSSTCLKNDGKPCGPKVNKNSQNNALSIPGSSHSEANVIDSLTYDCSGYNELSFPCVFYGSGKFSMSADKSIYFTCTIKGGTYVAECSICPQENKSCYSSEEKKCLENCGIGPHHQYDCSNRYSFKCSKEGLFAGLLDTSTFYKCVKRSDSTLEAQCFTCNMDLKTCFSNTKKACLSYGDKPCDKLDPAELPDSGSIENSRSYTCVGYGPLSFPCSKYPSGDTKYLHPGDASVYFECNDKSTAECKSCLLQMIGCFIEKEGKCIENCGKGPHIPYSCATYDDSSFPCVQTGYFAGVLDSSIFFKCIKISGKWESRCHSCSSTKLTCFSNSQQACVTNNGRQCGATDPFIENPNGGTEETSRTYDCSGYDKLSFPCKKHPHKVIHPHHGDKSVYFECKKSGNKWEARCKTCKEENYGCFAPKINRCVENCYLGPHYPYDCAKYNYLAYPCLEEGGYFSNPRDSATYFGCTKNRGVLMAYCYSCNRKTMTCFSDELQSCVTVGSKSTQADGCGAGEDPSTLEGAGTEEKSRSYDCEGYFTTSYPCHRIGKAGKYAMPGDKSVYFECIKKEDENTWIGVCYACPKETRSCFIEKKQDCVEECGKGPPPAPPQPPPPKSSGGRKKKSKGDSITLKKLKYDDE